jgi:hypothetical protein
LGAEKRRAFTYREVEGKDWSKRPYLHLPIRGDVVPIIGRIVEGEAIDEEYSGRE